MEHDSQPEAYYVHVWIRGIHPMLWRRFLVRSDSTLADLHAVLQIGFDWTDFHLHRIIRAFLSAVTTNSASKVSQELPSYLLSAQEIQDHSQVQPSFHRRNISNIADADLVDSTGLQILYQIGHSAVSRHCRARSEGLLATRRQFIFTHQPRYAILSAVDPILAKRLAHPGTAVTPFIGCKDSPYLLHQFGGGYLVNVYTPVSDTWKIRAAVVKFPTGP